MNAELLQRVRELAQRVGYVMVATADAAGNPHVAAATGLNVRSDGLLSITEWFCPGTLSNLDENLQISVVIWDSAQDNGYQLLGKVERVEDLAIMDGLEGTAGQTTTMPQVQRRMIVRVSKTLDFTLAPHSDVEEPHLT